MYFKKFLIIFLKVVIIYGQTQTLRSNLNLNLITNYNASVKPIPQIDVVGNIIRLLDQMMIVSSRNGMTPEKETCKARLIKVADLEFQISLNPIGSCLYCCPLHNPSQYLRLYFTNKSKAGRMEQLELRKKLPGIIRSAGINESLNTVIFIHGFGEHGLGPSPLDIRDAYLSRDEDHNIILVDWGDLCAFPWYPQAAQSTKLVGTVLAKFIKFYSDTGELPISKIHVIGFSLGGHIAGFIGKFFKGPMRIPRITGLDPALPLFSVDDISKRLSKADAEYVDIIHTDAGRFGFPISVGHADFYPNGGSFIQPGCEVSSLTEQHIIHQLGACGHLRAWNLYVESVRNPKAFPATKCGIIDKGLLRDCRFITEGYMGFAASKSTTMGNFFLTTRKKKPFSKPAKEQQNDMNRINLIL